MHAYQHANLFRSMKGHAIVWTWKKCMGLGLP
jgi:hypothetical protein